MTAPAAERAKRADQRVTAVSRCEARMRGATAPAVGLTVILEIRHASEWSPVSRGMTDGKGRVVTLTEGHTLAPGTYRLTFDTGTYHRDQGIAHPFFPEAKVTFQVLEPQEPHHV